jgi:hypothetical protein
MRITFTLVLASFVLGGCLTKVEPISSIDDASSGVDTPGAVGAVTLSWQPPTQNSDGTPLFDLAGYNIYVGTSSNSYEQMIRLDNPGLTTYVVENLSAGTYYFAATAFNSSDVESFFSGEAVVSIN